MGKDWRPEEIKELRKKLNLTQKQFADYLGYANYQRVIELEKGIVKPTKIVKNLLDVIAGEPDALSKFVKKSK